MTKSPPLVLIIDDNVGMRLDRWLRKRYPALRQGMIEKLVRQGKIRLNGYKVESGTRLEEGQVLTAPPEITILTEDTAPQPIVKKYELKQADRHLIESNILWEDDDLLVLNKPHGLAIQGGNKISQSLDKMLESYGEEKKTRYRLVHRLDRYTSGVCLIAKNQATAAHLTQCFREGLIEKTYWAVVLSQPHPDHGVIRQKLVKGELGDREKVYVDEKHGKLAITRYRTIKKLNKRKFPDLSWLELYPETGRTHQIRVHCQFLGTPIIGDGKYGGREAVDASNDLHLHARSIKMKDRYGNKFEFVAPPPAHFNDTLRRYGVEWSQYVR
jgi:23S rRNA pseudouridine955/2504/2580 synthase